MKVSVEGFLKHYLLKSAGVTALLSGAGAVQRADTRRLDS